MQKPGTARLSDAEANEVGRLMARRGARPRAMPRARKAAFDEAEAGE